MASVTEAVGFDLRESILGEQDGILVFGSYRRDRVEMFG
jgi:hypothetical protein